MVFKCCKISNTYNFRHACLISCIYHKLTIKAINYSPEHSAWQQAVHGTPRHAARRSVLKTSKAQCLMVGETLIYCCKLNSAMLFLKLVRHERMPPDTSKGANEYRPHRNNHTFGHGQAYNNPRMDEYQEGNVNTLNQPWQACKLSFRRRMVYHSSFHGKQRSMVINIMEGWLLTT